MLFMEHVGRHAPVVASGYIQRVTKYLHADGLRCHKLLACTSCVCTMIGGVLVHRVHGTGAEKRVSSMSKH